MMIKKSSTIWLDYNAIMGEMQLGSIIAIVSSSDFTFTGILHYAIYILLILIYYTAGIFKPGSRAIRGFQGGP